MQSESSNRANKASGFHPEGQEILLSLYHACANVAKIQRFQKRSKLTCLLMLPEKRRVLGPRSSTK